MTTPSNSPEPPAEGSAPPSDQAGTAATSSAAQPQPPAGPDPAPYQAPYQPPYQPPYQAAPVEPFAPVARAPRVPWINPARRGHVAAAAIAGVLLFGGCGLVVGHAVTVHRQHRDVVTRFERGPGGDGNAFPGNRYPRMGPGPRQNLPGSPVQSTPPPTPSTSPTR